MQAFEKRCVVCGTDVAQKRRVKDVKGRYYCQACADAGKAVAAASPGAVAANAVVQPPVPAPAGKVCENCGGAIGALQQPYDWEGHKVCWLCFETLRDDAVRQARPTANVATMPVVPVTEPVQQAVATEGQFEGKAFRGAKGWLGGGVGCALVGLGMCVMAWFTDHRVDREAYYTIGLWMLLPGMIIVIPFSYRFERLRPSGSPGLFAYVRAGAVILVWIALFFSAVMITTALCAGALSGLGAPDLLVGLAGLSSFVIGGIVWFAILAWPISGFCPKCLRFRAAKLIGTRVLGATEWTETRLEGVAVREGSSQSGRVLANYMIPVRVRLAQASQERRYTCRHCGHQWTKTAVIRRRVG
jgi:hypothetical protein